MIEIPNLKMDTITENDKMECMLWSCINARIKASINHLSDADMKKLKDKIHDLCAKTENPTTDLSKIRKLADDICGLPSAKKYHVR